jgi:hypothetical protein
MFILRYFIFFGILLCWYCIADLFISMLFEYEKATTFIYCFKFCNVAVCVEFKKIWWRLVIERWAHILCYHTDYFPSYFTTF